MRSIAQTIVKGKLPCAWHAAVKKKRESVDLVGGWFETTEHMDTTSKQTILRERVLLVATKGSAPAWGS